MQNKPAEEPETNDFIVDDAPVDQRKLPLPFKIIGVICIIGCVAFIPLMVLVALGIIAGFNQGAFADDGLSTTIVMCVAAGLMLAQSVIALVFGIRLLRNKRRHAAHACEVLLVLNVGIIICDVMLYGIGGHLIFLGIIMGLLIAMNSYIDPSLSQERELERKLRDMETREQAEDGTLGLDQTGKGFISLNFFNLFWIFVVCCFLGLVIETIYHMAVVEPGVYQDRAGMLFGPFSPIYGFGAVLMTLALNRFHDKSFIIIFLVSAVIGGAFEYAVSWFMQFAFGVVAWDYTGTFLSIDGRTNGMFMAMWGLLGLVWIKLLLPRMLSLINRIPWNWRYTVTTICAALMIVDGVMTLQSLDCWYNREAGKTGDTAIEEFYAKHFGNDYMANRFQSMTIDPSTSTRTE